MQEFWTIVTKAASLASALGAAIGVIWYFATLDGRVRDLENQVHALAISPTIVLTSPAPDKSSQSGQSATPQTTMTVPNPLQQTCADLAKRAAQAFEDGHPSTVAEPIQSLMKQIGCNALPNR